MKKSAHKKTVGEPITPLNCDIIKNYVFSGPMKQRMIKYILGCCVLNEYS